MSIFKEKNIVYEVFIDGHRVLNIKKNIKNKRLNAKKAKIYDDIIKNNKESSETDISYLYSKKKFNSEAIATIHDKIVDGDYDISEKLLDEYMKEYPYDQVAPLYRALIYIHTGREKEAEEMASCFYYNRYYDTTSRLKAASIYGEILIRVGNEEEALQIYKSILNEKDIEFYPDYYEEALTNYCSLCLDTEKYSELIDYIESDMSIRYDPVYILKLAIAYTGIGKYDIAEKIVKDNFDYFDRDLQQYSYYVLGRIYMLKNKNGDDSSYCYYAIDCFLKSIETKDVYYTRACYFLADLYKITCDIDSAYHFIEEVEKNITNKKSDLRILDYLPYIKYQLAMMCMEYDKAKELINCIKDEKIRIKAQIDYSFALGEYEECIKYCSKGLSTDNDIDFKRFLEEYICSYIRLGKYKEARYIIDSIYDIKTNELSYGLIDIVNAHIYKKLNRKRNKQSKTYTGRQITNYKSKVALKHIYDRHVMYDDNNFKNKREAKKFFYYALVNINPQNGIPDRLSDIHYLEIPEASRKDMNGLDVLKIATIPGTKNIITMFPIKNARKYVIRERINSEGGESNGKVQ